MNWALSSATLNFNRCWLRTFYGGCTINSRSTVFMQLSSVMFGLFVISVSYANSSSATFTKPLAPTQSIIIENTNLTAKNYFNVLMSDSVDERRYAELYLLGVLDATEGSVWCDYKTYKTIIIDETIFVELKKLSGQQLDKRAATVIKSILSQKFPCRSIK